jgi:hypothetical protein
MGARAWHFLSVRTDNARRQDNDDAEHLFGTAQEKTPEHAT